MRKGYLEDDEYSNKKNIKKPGEGNSKRKMKPEENILEIIDFDKIKAATKRERDQKYKVKKKREN
jgi:hypothetical protein